MEGHNSCGHHRKSRGRIQDVHDYLEVFSDKSHDGKKVDNLPSRFGETGTELAWPESVKRTIFRTSYHYTKTGRRDVLPTSYFLHEEFI